jgi:hypothetical protein
MFFRPGVKADPRSSPSPFPLEFQQRRPPLFLRFDPSLHPVGPLVVMELPLEEIPGPPPGDQLTFYAVAVRSIWPRPRGGGGRRGNT